MKLSVCTTCVMTGLAMILLAGSHARGQDGNTMIQNAIERFEPAWMPTRGELPEITIVLDPVPASGGRIAPAESLWTAEHLHHLLRRAGARTIVMRAATARNVEDAAMSLQGRLPERSREGVPPLLLRIDFSPAPPPNPPTDGGDDVARSLAAALGSATGVIAAIPGTTAASPSVHLCLELPPANGKKSPQPPPHRAVAEALYRALADWVHKHHGQRDTDRAERPDDNGDDDPSPNDPRERLRRRAQRLARSIWPEGDLPRDRIGWFVTLWPEIALSDGTSVLFDPRVEISDETLVLTGATSAAVLLDALPDALAAVGVGGAQNRMRLLPDQAALGERWFGACRVSMAMTYREPRAGSFPQSQLLFGEPVFLLDRADGFLLLQAGDGYWGWVREEAIERMDRSTFRPFAGHRKAVFIEDARIEGVSLPRGASLPLVAKTEDHVTVLTPGGGRLSVPAGQVREVDLQAAMERRAEAALRMLHTPYVFGGRSPLGPDCSGIITNLCEQEGLPIARDAAQQVLSGKLVGTRWHRDDIRAGDRLYFLNGNGKVFHAGIALSPTHFVHAAPPEVQISSLRPGDRLYSDHWDRAFLAAKRP